ncbi:hypothetical protein [Haloferax sp. Atlit-4N]|uniref:hypothetical protein n=1 Tax=Haloferax sp. Atlit-4N TaxID=2077206 RepID=UPI0011C0555F|nr:hypothetical protein [Haloferax sp. Atlit-4N]
MSSKIGDWPSNWELVEVGSDSSVKESESDGDDGFRAIPSHLDGAVHVVHNVVKHGPSSKTESWDVSIQSEHGILGEKGKKGYKTRWSKSVDSQAEAETLISDTVNDLESVQDLTDISYLPNSL